jgi:hypothetical protein
MRQRREQNRNTSLHTYGLYTWGISRHYLLIPCLLKAPLLLRMYLEVLHKPCQTQFNQCLQRFTVPHAKQYGFKTVTYTFTKNFIQLSMRRFPIPFTLTKASTPP